MLTPHADPLPTGLWVLTCPNGDILLAPTETRLGGFLVFTTLSRANAFIDWVLQSKPSVCPDLPDTLELRRLDGAPVRLDGAWSETAASLAYLVDAGPAAAHDPHELTATTLPLRPTHR